MTLIRICSAASSEKGSTVGAATAQDVESLTWAKEHQFVIITNDLDVPAILRPRRERAGRDSG
jgi:predicted nuclease of predicted toxin-antitoxin system